MLRTNSKEYKQRIEAYLLEAITEGETPKEKINNLFNAYESEFNYSRNKQLYPNEQQRFEEYLLNQGGCISLPVYYDDYVTEAEKIHSCSIPEEKHETIKKLFYRNIAFNLIRIKNKYQ